MNILNCTAQDIALNSTLNVTSSGGFVAYANNVIEFTCITRGVSVLEWYSDEYIGADGDRLQLLSLGDHTNVSSTKELTTFAVRGSVDYNAAPPDGPVIVSKLYVTPFLRYPNASVTCTNGQTSMLTIQFQTLGIYIVIIMIRPYFNFIV